MCLELETEKKLKKDGYDFVIGIDESGRGPLAGPVVAVAVVIDLSGLTNSISGSKRNFRVQDLGIRDSKKLSAQKREELHRILKDHFQVKWARGLATAKVIDKVNILEATKLAARRAVRNLERKRGKRFPRKKTILIMDGNQGIASDFLEISIIKADEKIFSCACASILAKVERDNLMRKYHKVYPQYNFIQHKGYPTKEHYKRIKKYGLSSLHRRSFRCF